VRLRLSLSAPGSPIPNIFPPRGARLSHCHTHHCIFERSAHSRSACCGAELFDIAEISIHLPSLARVPSSGGEALPHLGRRFRLLLPSESAPFQLLLPTKWIRAISWPPHALTRVCDLEERRGAQGDTTGIETRETVRGSTTGKQQLLAVLLLLRKRRGGGGFCIHYHTGKQ